MGQSVNVTAHIQQGCQPYPISLTTFRNVYYNSRIYSIFALSKWLIARGAPRYLHHLHSTYGKYFKIQTGSYYFLVLEFLKKTIFRRCKTVATQAMNAASRKASSANGRPFKKALSDKNVENERCIQRRKRGPAPTDHLETQEFQRRDIRISCFVQYLVRDWLISSYVCMPFRVISFWARFITTRRLRANPYH